MNPVMNGFLSRQLEDGLKLASASDLLHLLPMPDAEFPPYRYLARFRCKGLVTAPDGDVVEADCFDVGIQFPEDYLRIAEPSRVLTWLYPENVWHPNIFGPARAICVGRMAPGTPLVDLLYQIFEIISYRKVTMREDDALNRACCQWARQNMTRFPVDSRPLKRRAVDLAITIETQEEQRNAEPIITTDVS